jgi:hypothetical protein
MIGNYSEGFMGNEQAEISAVARLVVHSHGIVAG